MQLASKLCDRRIWQRMQKGGRPDRPVDGDAHQRRQMTDPYPWMHDGMDVPRTCTRTRHLPIGQACMHACDLALLTLDRAWVMGHYFHFRLPQETTGVFTILFPKSFFISFTLTSRYMHDSWELDSWIPSMPKASTLISSNIPLPIEARSSGARYTAKVV